MHETLFQFREWNGSLNALRETWQNASRNIYIFTTWVSIIDSFKALI